MYHSPVLALTATRFYRTYVDEQSTLIAAVLMAFHEWMRNLYIRLAEPAFAGLKREFVNRGRSLTHAFLCGGVGGGGGCHPLLSFACYIGNRHRCCYNKLFRMRKHVYFLPWVADSFIELENKTSFSRLLPLNSDTNKRPCKISKPCAKLGFRHLAAARPFTGKRTDWQA